MEKKNKGGCFVGVGFIILFIIFLFMGYSEKSEENKKKNPPPPEQVIVLVKTERFTLGPGERIVFSTKDPETGLLCNYLPIWEKYTNDSLLHHTVHGPFGKDGVGSKIHGHYIHPISGGTFNRGDSIPINDEVHFVMVRNEREDTVIFSVELYGMRDP